MTRENDETVAVLNDLIETCKDGVNGFRTAAAAVKNAEAKTLFASRVRMIELAATELQAEVRRLGGDPETTGSVAAKIHRGWIGLKAAVTGQDDAAIITECERGEQVAVKNYEDARKKDLPTAVRVLVERQYQGAVDNLERVRALGRAAGADKPIVAPRPAADREVPPRM
ncbi:MAG: PA2169 family four-helix-bundle protein [Gemmatimonadota bacterium]|nr:PA2169 family four-helix-bundle protein [Gemmatimonadota bacterium]